MCRSMVDIQSASAEIRRGIKKDKKPQAKNIMSASATQGGHNKYLLRLVHVGQLPIAAATDFTDSPPMGGCITFRRTLLLFITIQSTVRALIWAVPVQPRPAHSDCGTIAQGRHTPSVNDYQEKTRFQLLSMCLDSNCQQ